MKSFVSGLFALSLLLFSSVLWADDDQKKMTAHLVTVQQAQRMADETLVRVYGHVVKALGDEKYQFRDKTGTMIVEIDDELWEGRAVTAAQPLMLIGELDISRNAKKPIKLEVEKILFK